MQHTYMIYFANLRPEAERAALVMKTFAQRHLQANSGCICKERCDSPSEESGKRERLREVNQAVLVPIDPMKITPLLSFLSLLGERAVYLLARVLNLVLRAEICTAYAG